MGICLLEISSRGLQGKVGRTGIMVVWVFCLCSLRSLLRSCKVAHPILAGIETKFMAESGRNWLRHGNTARLAIVVSSRNINGLKMFDPRMVWQITSSIFIVCGTVFGALILSYLTPTVGLGCHAGGYLVYVVVTLSLLTIEIGVWWLTHENTNTQDDILARVGSKFERHISRSDGQQDRRTASIWRLSHVILLWFRSRTFRDVVKNFVIRPLEIMNTIWLTYIIFAQ